MKNIYLKLLARITNRHDIKKQEQHHKGHEKPADRNDQPVRLSVPPFLLNNRNPALRHES